MITNLCDHVEMAKRIWSNFPERRVFDSALIVMNLITTPPDIFIFIVIVLLEGGEFFRIIWWQ